MKTVHLMQRTPDLETNSSQPTWHRLRVEQVVAMLDSDQANGLSAMEADKRLGQYGLNELIEEKRRTWPGILIAQLQSSLVLLLVVAAAISIALGESTDAIAIVTIIALNTLLGFWQDFKAEEALAELKKIAATDVTVRRDGITSTVSASTLVPGDVVVLQSGYFVPADCRVLEQSELAIDESALTGESVHASKTTKTIQGADIPVGDRKNSVFKGTVVVRGRGRAIVVSTGMRTELGKIADSLQSVESEPTPLQVKLGQLSQSLAVVAVVIVAMMFFAGLVGGQEPRLMLLTAISMAVALVPEGLPAVATVALAVGARRMFKRNALIRELPAVETLGSVSVICSDKTGTLTQNKMTATILDLPGHRIDVAPEIVNIEVDTSVALLLTAAALCNDAQLDESNSNAIVAVGEPTEKALVEVAARFGFHQYALRNQLPRIAEIPFDSVRKRMTTLHAVPCISNSGDNPELPLKVATTCFPAAQQVAFTKGAVDSLLEISSFIWSNGQRVPMNDQWIKQIGKSRDALAGQGTRVLAIAFRPEDSSDNKEAIERDVVFVGMIGLADPPRPEAKTAVELCKKAGIRPIMITGDHPLTALSIANQIGIINGGRVLTGQQLAQLDSDALREQVKQVSVFARVAPADKLNIVEALQHAHEVVAMTGDGVNDAPALKQASVGVAMGITGTDVSKQAANVVLLDDNFATIVAAVEQGRNVYDNVRKFVKYAMSGNLGEVLVMTVGIVFGMPLPLLPLQILWVNLVTDGLPGLALAIEPAEKGTMERLPVPLDEPIINRQMIWDLVWIGSWICLGSLAAGSLLWSEAKGVAHWRTIVFTVLTISQMANVFACRSDSPVVFQRALFKNKWLWSAVASTFILQLAVIYWQPMQNIFQTTSLSVIELSTCIGLSLLVFAVIELGKPLRRWAVGPRLG